MKKIFVTALLFACIATLSLSCEKDDLCAEGTPTTPSILVEFYNYEVQSELNPVTLRYYVPGMEDTITTAANITSIRIPLRTDVETTQWALERSTPVTGGGVTLNTDILTFNYTTRQIYVSRACGYKSVFDLLPDTEDEPNPALSDAVPADNLWIRDILVVNPNIENENEAHINIYF